MPQEQVSPDPTDALIVCRSLLVNCALGHPQRENLLVLLLLPLEEYERRLGGVVHSARAVVVGLGGLHATGLLGLLVIDLAWTSARVRSVCSLDHVKNIQIIDDARPLNNIEPAPEAPRCIHNEQQMPLIKDAVAVRSIHERPSEKDKEKQEAASQKTL